MSVRSWVVGVVVCVMACVVSAAAVASAVASPLGFESSSVLASKADASPDLLAGSHPYAVTTAFKVNVTTNSEGRLLSEGGDPRDVVAELPPGLMVNPSATTQCGAQEFATFNSTTGEDGCPNASAVGVVAVENVTASTLAERKVTVFPLYDLVPTSNVPATFGFMAGGAPVYLTPSLRTGGDYGLTVTMAGIPQAAHVLGSAVTFWGVPAESVHDEERGDCVESLGKCPAGVPLKPFLDLPGQCTTTPTTALRADSWQEAGQFSAFASDSLTGGAQALTACDKLDFTPSFHAQPESATADAPTGLKLDVKLPQSEDPSGLAEADLKDAVVALPAGMTLNLARANNLIGCALEGTEGINLSSSDPGHCPDTSRVGYVKVKTPFLSEEMHGGVYVAQQGNLTGGGTNPFNSLLALYIVAEGSGVVLKLPAEVVANRETGQLTMHIGPDPVTGQASLPPLPMADLELEFSGGQQSAFVTPATCGDYTTNTSLTPWSGAAPATPSDDFHITEGCANAFKPSFSAGTVNKRANAFSPLTITLGRQDGEQELKSMSTSLPLGLLAVLTGVTLCPEPQASLGTCGGGSLIGDASSSLGAGSEPFVIGGGKVYFTGPYGGGPFGLSIVMPALAGPFNLGPGGGPVVIRAAIHVDPNTGQASIATDAIGVHSIPSILEGIVPQIKAVNIAIDRPQFIFNPSSCMPQSFAGAVTSTQGTTANVSTPFASTECDTLPFGPKLTAATVGNPSRVNGVGLNVKIVEGFAWESNAHSVKVELPKQLPSRLSTLNHACLLRVFEANPAACPSLSVVGTANAVTTVLPVPLVGPAYFVSHGGAKFPELAIVLQGYGVTVILHGETFIDKNGISSSTFPQIPDAPVPSFELHLPPGKNSVLTANGDLCAGPLRMPTIIVAENGKTVKESPQIVVSSCRPAIKVLRHSFHRHVATIAVSVPSAGKLVAGGKGFSRATKKFGKAGTATVKLALSKSERRMLARHRRGKLKLTVKLLFTPSHGAKLSTHVTIRVR